MFVIYTAVLLAAVLVGSWIALEAKWWLREWRRQAHAGRRKGRIL